VDFRHIQLLVVNCDEICSGILPLSPKTEVTMEVKVVSLTNETGGNGGPYEWQQSFRDFNGSYGHRVTDTAASSLAGKIVLALLLSSFVVVALAGNLLVIVAVMTDRNLRRTGNYFIVSLALADALVAAVVMTFAIVNDVTGRWLLPVTSRVVPITSRVAGCSGLGRVVSGCLLTSCARRRLSSTCVLSAWIVTCTCAVRYITSVLSHTAAHWLPLPSSGLCRRLSRSCQYTSAGTASTALLWQRSPPPQPKLLTRRLRRFLITRQYKCASILSAFYGIFCTDDVILLHIRCLFKACGLLQFFGK